MKTNRQKVREAQKAQALAESNNERLRQVLRMVHDHFPETREAVHEMLRPRYAEFHTMDGRVIHVRTG